MSSTLQEVAIVTGKQYKRVLLDKGYRGAKLYEGCSSEKIIPGKKGMDKKSYTYRSYKGKYKRRSEIEARISHLKHSHKLGRNYLQGSVGDIVNSLLAGAGYNMHLLLLELEKKVKQGLNFLLLYIKLSFNRNMVGRVKRRLVYSLPNN